MNPILLDTGPIVAILDRKDPYHTWVTPRFGRVTGTLLTTGAVVTEATFFLQNVIHGIESLFELLANPKIVISDCFSSSRLRASAVLMHRYADTPMDFADASLVVLASELNIGQVLTLDERGFRTYRHGRNKPFQLVLQDI